MVSATMVAASDLRVSLEDVDEARRQVRGVAWRTPTLPAGRDEDGQVYLKLESLQRLGSFKIRGAWNRMSRSTQAERARGFVTVSAGNHGQAVAWSAKRLGAPCTVWVPETAVQRKIDAIKALGATVRTMPHELIMSSMTGDHFSKGPETFIHPFADPYVIAGQGTIGLEILEDLPETASILVPVGGGGLVTGIAIAAKAVRPAVKVYGVQAANAAPLAKSWASKRPEQVPSPQTIADGIGASRVFDYMLPHLLRLMDGVFTVSEDELRAGVRELAREAHVIAEPAAAASLAAARQRSNLESPVVCVVSGGNIGPQLLRELVGDG